MKNLVLKLVLVHERAALRCPRHLKEKYRHYTVDDLKGCFDLLAALEVVDAHEVYIIGHPFDPHHI